MPHANDAQEIQELIDTLSERLHRGGDLIN